MKRLLFIVSEDWYFLSHRLHLAKAAINAGYEVGLISRVSSYRDIIESAGIKVIDWQISRRSSNPFHELSTLFDLWRGIRLFRPDIVHAVALKPVIYASIACFLSGIQSRVSALGGLGFVFSSSNKYAAFLRPFIIFLFKIALRGKKSILILQNPDDAEILTTAGVIAENRIRMIRGAGVDTQLFSPANHFPDKPLVILPARMLWAKGIGEFVNAARRVRIQRPDVRFVLVGAPDDQNLESVSIEQLQEWVRDGIVEWWGRCENMPEVYRQATIVCLPTSYGEGLPKALLEAASCEIPIVTYDVPGCREVVQDGNNGFLVPLKNEEMLFASLMKLIEDPELCKRMGIAGRKMVLDHFSQEQVAEETMRVWEELLQEGAK
ncbi:glycosyltransferase family 4 protein [Desulfoplanes formicivorans]|uniref:Glycosyl transferase family 1 n=1 Tax=Desulfoplanes formicivorans TaxID=1592317 RepID=A0A194AIK9_9BACT|nr:glycosyltransferase family 4 protein [Desulfoplanes formicivorans]GAU09922.1 glycosyl transferase family 1 [Desulfoplanes formicivorans]